MTATRSLKSDFRRSIAHGITLVDFIAPWCQPCRKQAIIMKALRKAFQQSARVGTVNIDKHPQLAQKLGIQSIPTTILYQNGKEIDRFVGLRTSQELARALKEAMHSFSTEKQGTSR